MSAWSTTRNDTVRWSLLHAGISRTRVARAVRVAFRNRLRIPAGTDPYQLTLFALRHPRLRPTTIALLADECRSQERPIPGATR